MMTANISVVSATLAEPRALSALLEEAYGPQKQRFLLDHGDWWYRGTQRLVIMHDESVAGYSGVIPTTCLVEGEKKPALWAVDLYVAAAFRGLGLQRVITDRLHEMTDLHLAFANDLSAEIYRRQRGGRVRDDMGVLLLPLNPRGVGALRRATGPKGMLLRAAGVGLSAPAAAYRRRAVHYQPKYTAIADPPDPAALEGIFWMFASPDSVTTVRDAEFLSWRYLDSPYRPELVFYVTQEENGPSLYAIVRYLVQDGWTRARILDIFGDFENEPHLSDLLRTIVRDAAVRGVTQITALACPSGLWSALRRVGFLARSGAHFCWTARDPRVQDLLTSVPLHWTLGDSDYDEPT
jgi:hypothetical protein